LYQKIPDSYLPGDIRSDTSIHQTTRKLTGIPLAF